MIEPINEQEKLILETMQDSFIKFKLNFALDSRFNRIKSNIKTLFTSSIEKIKNMYEINDLSMIIKNDSVANKFSKHLNTYTRGLKLNENNLVNATDRVIKEHFKYMFTDILYREETLKKPLSECQFNIIIHFYQQIGKLTINPLNKLQKLYNIDTESSNDYEISEKVKWLKDHKDEIIAIYKEKSLLDNIESQRVVTYVNRVLNSNIKELIIR